MTRTCDVKTGHSLRAAKRPTFALRKSRPITRPSPGRRTLSTAAGRTSARPARSGVHPRALSSTSHRPRHRLRRKVLARRLGVYLGSCREGFGGDRALSGAATTRIRRVARSRVLCGRLPSRLLLGEQRAPAPMPTWQGGRRERMGRVWRARPRRCPASVVKSEAHSSLGKHAVFCYCCLLCGRLRYPTPIPKIENQIELDEHAGGGENALDSTDDKAQARFTSERKRWGGAVLSWPLTNATDFSDCLSTHSAGIGLACELPDQSLVETEIENTGAKTAANLGEGR